MAGRPSPIKHACYYAFMNKLILPLGVADLDDCCNDPRDVAMGLTLSELRDDRCTNPVTNVSNMQTQICTYIDTLDIRTYICTYTYMYEWHSQIR